MGVLKEGRLSEEASSWIFQQDLWIKGRRIVWKTKNSYVVLVIRPKRVSVVHVPLEVVEEIKEYISRTTTKVKPSEISKRLKISEKLCVSAFHILWVMGIVKRGKKGYERRT